MLLHFTDGLPSIPWSKLQFGFHGYTFTVTGVVQYLRNPDHFVAWLRNPESMCFKHHNVFLFFFIWLICFSVMMAVLLNNHHHDLPAVSGLVD